MKNNIRKLSLQSVSLMIIAVAFITVVMSCSKSATKATFSGTYYGKLVTGLYTEADTIIIPASTSSSVVMNTRTGRGSSYSINGTISGTTISIPSQSVFVSTLGATYGVSGTGTLNNSTLVINYVFISSSDVTTNFTFTGTKK